MSVQPSNLDLGKVPELTDPVLYTYLKRLVKSLEQAYRNIAKGVGDPLQAYNPDPAFLRSTWVTVSDGATASTITVQLASEFGGVTQAVSSDIAKAGSDSNISLDATGDTLTIAEEALGHACSGIVAATLSCGHSIRVLPQQADGDITLDFFDLDNEAAEDLTSLVDTRDVVLLLAYVTVT